VKQESFDLVVVGAGPAGISAAVEASRWGVSVALVDENPAPGGNIYRQPPKEFAPLAPSAGERGAALRRALDASPVRRFPETTVWGAFRPDVLEAVRGGDSFALEGRFVIVAAGAYDRPVPVPGWTLPGVLTVGGAQTLLKGQRMLPGRRILFAGTGPLLLVVAAQYAEAGAEIVAVADAARIGSLAGHVPGLLSAPALLRDGMRYRWRLLRRRVPWLSQSVLLRVEGRGEVESASIVQIDDSGQRRTGTERRFEVDTVCVGYGLVPSVELLQLLGCALRYDEAAACWIPRRNDDFETSVPSVFAVGDGAGVAGAVVAADEGRVAGLAVARALGRIGPPEAQRLQRPLRRRLRRLARFRAAMEAAYGLPQHLLDGVTADTIVCRCEEVRRREIDEAIGDGALTPAQLKAWTRVGMGPCQGRMCSLPVAELLSRSTERPIAELGPPSVRPPVKPVPIGALTDTD
jgi:NADPH-dependent 2,4-dienoyl-CoA reductase/sulfur reductase-like enzyme